MDHPFDNFTKVPQSYWIASTPETNFPNLEDDVEVDVAIVGGGIVGITTAHLLKNEGFRVCVVEADHIVQGTTAHTTAKITSQHSFIYDRIKTEMGESLAQQYADANETAIREIARLIQEKNIDCDFSWQNAYMYTKSEEYIQKLQRETETASSLGIKASFLSEIPLPIPVKGAMCFEQQAQFHPRKYLLALAQDIPGKSSFIFEQTKIVEVLEGSPNILVADSGKKVSAKKVIIASHFPCYEAMGLYFTRIYPERSYSLGVKIKGNFPGGMYISAEDPTRSVRYQAFEEGQLILVSGEHHKTGQGEDTRNHYSKLKDFAEKYFEVEDIPFRWSTQDYTTMDEVPYIGNLTSGTPDIYVATGFRKWGMTNSMVSALIFRDLLTNGTSPWAEVYNPSRFTPVASAKNFVKENINVAKNLISGKITPIPPDINIPSGEGRIIEVEGERVGAYRDEKGTLHLIDSTCTHMGCELQWNAAEKSWDCPCHGSRFTYEGEIIEGPALTKLQHVKQNY